MEIKKELLSSQIYKDANGNTLPSDGTIDWPEGATEVNYTFVTVEESLFLKDENGEFKKALTGHSEFSEDLALAIMEHEGLSLKDSIVAAAKCCERCMNALAYEYDLEWGYPECGEEWQACGTSCSFCKYMDETAGDFE